jgi:hypothetical protein
MWTCVLNVETRKRLQHANEPRYNYVANALYTLDADLHTLVLHVHLSDGLYWGQCFLGSLVPFPGAGTGVWIFSTGNVHRRVGWVACHTPFMDGPRGPLCNWPRGLGPVSGALGWWHAARITSLVSSFSVYVGGGHLWALGTLPGLSVWRIQLPAGGPHLLSTHACMCSSTT